jgi:hypothetical protein
MSVKVLVGFFAAVYMLATSACAGEVPPVEECQKTFEGVGNMFLEQYPMCELSCCACVHSISFG